MDPASLIELALVAGAAAGAKDTASAAVKDAYAGLKAIVKSRFAGRPRAELVLAEHEAAPQTAKESLIAELTNVGVDAELLTAAKSLMQLIDPAGSQAGKYDVDMKDAQGVQIGDHNTQHNTFSAAPKFNVIQMNDQSRIDGSIFQIHIGPS
jgi:hypothetical protein